MVAALRRLARRPVTALGPAMLLVVLGWRWSEAQAPNVDLRSFWAEPAWMQAGAPPPSHDATWLQGHGAAATAEGADCASCHTEDRCTQCHAGTDAPLSVHGAGYVLLHGVDAQHGADSCGSCHAEARFCRSCHSRSLIDAEAPDRATARSPHPPGWSLSAHAVEARRDLVACTSCHTEASCASCHASVDPHGPDFTGRCRSLRGAAGSMCAGCHDVTPPCP